MAASSVVVASSCALAGTPPTLIGSSIAPAGSMGPMPLALTGPISVDPRDPTDRTLMVTFEFDAPVIAYRTVSAAGADVSLTPFTPGSSTVTVEIDGATAASYASVTLTEVVAEGGGILPRATASVGFQTGDMDGDGGATFADVTRFIAAFNGQDAIADLDSSGALDFGDVTVFLDAFADPQPRPNAAPTVTPLGSVFAPMGSRSRGVVFRLRDDRLDESDLSVVALSGDAGVVDPSSILVAPLGDEFEISVVGGSGVEGATTVTLLVSDGVQEISASMLVRVGEDTPPRARFAAPRFLGVAPLAVSAEASASSDPEENIALYAWAVDGQPAGLGRQLAVTLTEPGDHEISLTVYDDSGNTDTATRTVTVAPAAHDLSAPVSEAEASRFLWQASFGPNAASVAEVMALGYAGWIDAQLATPATLMWRGPADYDVSDAVFDDYAVEAPDQLRQRMAWALIQLIVIGERGLNDEQAGYVYSIFQRHALGHGPSGDGGNYRELLEEITYSAAMGDWLTYTNNKKANPELGSSPDENYAREIMQLFSIGLYELNDDGTRKLNPFGEPSPTYENANIQQLARVFTGLRRAGGDPGYPTRVGPMIWKVSDHEFGDKQLLAYEGSVPPGGYIPEADPSQANADMDIADAIDNVFLHPSCPAFVAERLIKRFVTSNPTDLYVARVAEAFKGGGPYGTGVRGDLVATLRAILLDDEARNPAYRSNPLYGRAKEPVQLLLGAARVMGYADEPANVFPNRINRNVTDNFGEDTGQAFMRTPSVFNFYRPEYAPARSEISAALATAPELQIFTESKALGEISNLRNQLVDQENDWDQTIRAHLESLSDVGSAELIEELDRMFNFSSTSGVSKAIMVDAINQITGTRDRVRSALYLTLFNPEYRVLR